MCGIIGMIGNTPVLSHLLKSIENLINRGYDSVGIFLENNIIKCISDNDKQAFELLKEKNINNDNLTGIGHTRWATHGSISIDNAHPHTSNNTEVVLVHNGIINNYIELKKKLISKNFSFYSETDTEVICNLIQYHLETNEIIDAINKTIKDIEGTYGICLYYKKTPNKLYCFKLGSPLIVAKTDEHLIVTSEITGLNNMGKNYIILENNDICVLERTHNGDLSIKTNLYYNQMFVQDEYNFTKTREHWTLSEIHDQPNSLKRVINNGGRILSDTNVNIGGIKSIMKENDLSKYKNILLIGCGTSFYAAKIGAYYFKHFTHFDNVVAIDGCELISDNIPNNSVAILLSQSGETRDLIVCLEELNKKYSLVLGCINKVDSYLAKKTTCGIYLNAGIERGVASTKSFTSQLVALNLIAIQFSEINVKKNILASRKQNISDIITLPYSINSVLENQKIIDFAEKIKNKSSMFILGKGIFLPIAEEGALKIKELSYIHAEAYSGSALKHGPFSLLEEGFPVVAIIHIDEHYSKMRIALDEIKTRKGDVLVLTNDVNLEYEEKIIIQSCNTLSEIQYVILLQRLAYYLSIKRGINPDFPKNLAKVVTVD